jgi:uncharacterized iron-regulated membrane protein
MPVNPRLLNRQLHRWGAVAVALPFLVVIVTGVMLQLKKQIPWVQPPERKVADVVPALTLPQILTIVQSVPEAKATGWSDIDRFDVRPSKGIVKVITKGRWELQLDLATGAVLQSAYRRSDLIEQFHDGSWFHEAAKLWIFLPSGILVLGLWVTGIYLYLLPIRTRAKRASTASRGTT